MPGGFRKSGLFISDPGYTMRNYFDKMRTLKFTILLSDRFLFNFT